MKLFQLDVKEDFLYGVLDEEAFVEGFLGYEIVGHEHKHSSCKKLYLDLCKLQSPYMQQYMSIFVKNDST
jgi:hypothetical protein